MGAMPIGKTSSEVKNRWNAKTYKRYQISLRKDEDSEIIEFVESVKDRIRPSEIFRIGAEQLKKRDGNKEITAPGKGNGQ